MTYKIHYFYIIIALVFLCAGRVLAERWHALEDTGPSFVDISGVIHPGDSMVLNGNFDAVIDFYNEDNSIPTISIKEIVSIQNNYFRVSLDLRTVLIPMFEKRKKMYVKLTLENGLSTVLPFASVPSSVKASFSDTTYQMMDDDLFYADYDEHRIGIGTIEPQSLVHVVGTVNATSFVGDGSGLYNLTHGGSDSYYFLNSRRADFSAVVTVNSDGKMMIGARPDRDVPNAHLQVYGSLLVEPNDQVTSNMMSGQGSRWMWYSDRSILRIGYTPSTMWDSEFSGDDSISFGYAGLASGPYSIITGGYYNIVGTSNSIVMGGSRNKVDGVGSIILGGKDNRVGFDSSVILGGGDNLASNNSIVLGGFDNDSTGEFSIVSGYENELSGDSSIILGGLNNIGHSQKSLLIGSNIRTLEDHDYTVLFGASDALVESSVSRHIKLNVPNGVGIGTNTTEPGQIKISGSVTANAYYGDGSLIRNIKDANSAWIPHSAQIDFLMYPNRMGVGTGNLLEALNVSGSIHLSGEAEPVDGAIRYFDDTFSVYKEGEWVSLQMVDTDTTYNAQHSMILDEPHLTFYVSTKDALIGHVKVWDGAQWRAGFMDQFTEEAEADRRYDFPVQKRLFLPTGNVGVNISQEDAVISSAFSLMTNPTNPTALYMYGNGDDGVERMISMTTLPPGLHFQGFYEGAQFKQTSVEGGGMILENDQFSFYVDSPSGEKTDALTFSTHNVGVMGPVDSDYPFYVHGDFGSRSFLFQSNPNGTGIYLRAPYFNQSPADAEVVFQANNGELFIQAGNNSDHIFFNQVPDVVATLKNDNGRSKFSLGNGKPYEALTLSDGNTHVSDGYGMEFFELSTKRSGVAFDSTQGERIQIHTSSEFDTPNVVISDLGNMGVHGPYNDAYDLILRPVTDRSTIFQLDTMERKNPGILFNVDGAGVEADNDFDDEGEIFALQMTVDDLILHEDQAGVSFAVKVDQDTGFVGIYEHDPVSEVSIGSDMVLLNQTGIYFQEQDGTSGPAIQMSDDSVQVRSSDRINFIDSSGAIALSVADNGVAINDQKQRISIDSHPIGFEVYDSMMVSGDIYNVLDDKIFPLNVKNVFETKQERTINGIEIDSVSGLTLNGNNTTSTLNVVASAYYNRIKVPDGILEATKNMDIRFIGHGITITANNLEARHVGLPNDTLKIINDLMSGGEINGNLNVKGYVTVMDGYTVSGNAHGLRNIPYFWEHVTRNPTLDDDPPNAHYTVVPPYGDRPLYSDEGEIFYLDGNVGINTSLPTELFEVVGTSSVDDIIISKNLTVSDIVSTATVHIESKQRLLFRSNENSIVFGRNYDVIDELKGFKEFMRITHSSQWLIGTDASSYLLDVGQRSVDDTTEVIVESDWGIMLDMVNGPGGPSLNIRHDDTGERFSRSFSNANIQLNASNGMAFITHGVTRSITLDNAGHVGIFEDLPKNMLDVHGKMSIGYKEDAPTNGLIVKEIVGIGFDYLSDDENDVPRNPLEVSGSVIVGQPFAEEVPVGVFIKGDGTHQLLIGGDAKGTEALFVTGNISMKHDSRSHARVLLRMGEDSGMLIQRNKSTKLDNWTQIEPGKGLKIHASKDISFKSYNGTSWVDEMVLDETGQLGIGTVPDEVLHLKDDDSGVSAKIKSSGVSAIHLQTSIPDTESVNAMFGTDAKGFHFKTNQTSLSSPELTIANGKVGINNDTPDDYYKMDVKGTLHANDYKIKDQFHPEGFRSFQTVPTGIIVLWLGDGPVPEGWEECGVENEDGVLNTMCPDMSGKFVKAFGDDYVTGSGSLKDSDGVWLQGGTNNAYLSSSPHEHPAPETSHSHYLKAGRHSHGYTLKTIDNGFDTPGRNGLTNHISVTNVGSEARNVYWHRNMNGGGNTSGSFYVYGSETGSGSDRNVNFSGAEKWNSVFVNVFFLNIGYEVLLGTGHHTHSMVNRHNHPGSLSNETVNGYHHASHGVSNYTPHGHGGNNTSGISPSDSEDQLALITKTVGRKSFATGIYGDEHIHNVNNQPMSRPVRFIVKVDEDVIEASGGQP